MKTEFRINATGFTPIEREAIKRSIIDQGRRYRVNVHAITDDGYFCINLAGDRETVVVYEVAVKCWFSQQEEQREYVL